MVENGFILFIHNILEVFSQSYSPHKCDSFDPLVLELNCIGPGLARLTKRVKWGKFNLMIKLF